MDRVWRESPMAALRTWHDANGLRVEANAAARAWAVLHGLWDDDWRALAAAGEAQAASQAGDIELKVGPAGLALTCRRVSLPDGSLWWIEPRRATDDAQRLLADQLDLAQDFGRMGLFVRDLDTGTGHWDRHVHRIFGLPETEATPDFPDMLRRCIHPDDAQALQEHHRGIGAGGQQRGSFRYRIVRPGGEVRHIHSLYEIRPGEAGRQGRLAGVLIDDTEAAQRIAAEQQANQVLARALQLAAVSVWRIDLGSERIHLNAVGFELLGLAPDPDGLPLALVRDLIHPEDRAAVVQAAEDAAGCDRVIDVVARYGDACRGWRALLTRRVAYRDDTGRVTALTGIAIDVSAQRAERERAEALAARARLAAEAMGVGFWSREGDDGQAQSHWDEQMHRIHRRDLALGPPSLSEWITQCVHPHDQAWVAELQARTIEAWQPVTDITFRLPDGPEGERWVQTWTRRVVQDGRRLMFGMHLDVTEHRRTQWQLQRERERQQFAINAAGIGVWERASDGVITYWNEAMYRLRGLDPADTRRREDLLALTSHPDDHATMLVATREQLASGQPFRTEFRVRGADGGWRWVASQSHPVHDVDGRLLGLAGVNHDVTERKRADALQLEKQRAEQASRDKSAFMARMSHELRTPMNAVLGFAQLLEDDLAEPPTGRQRSRLMRIRQAGSELMAMIEDVLDIARLDTEAPASQAEPVAVAGVALQVVDMVAALAERHGQRLQLGPLPVAAFVEAVGSRLAQALSQLAVHVLRGHEWPDRLQLSAAVESGSAGAMVVFSLRGDGPSMPPAVLSSLFDLPGEPDPDAGPGEQVSAPGLNLARRAIEAMGGSVEVDGQDASGTVLRVRMPLADMSGPPAAPSAGGIDNTAVPAGPAPLKVLCVEDNPVNLLLVRELLALRPGVVLSSAMDGTSGIELALAERPDLLLLDLSLPDIPGLEVLRRLRAEPALAGSVFIALSANAMPADIQQGLEAGFDEYWTKPIDFDRFLAGIDRLAADRVR